MIGGVVVRLPCQPHVLTIKKGNEGLLKTLISTAWSLVGDVIRGSDLLGKERIFELQFIEEIQDTINKILGFMNVAQKVCTVMGRAITSLFNYATQRMCK